MENFFKYLGNFLFSFFSSIGTAALDSDNYPFILGIYIVAMVIYILYIMSSDMPDKSQTVMAAGSGLFVGILTAIEIIG